MNFVPPTPLTAHEYLNHLLYTAYCGCPVTHHHLEILKKLIVEGERGVYVP